MTATIFAVSSGAPPAAIAIVRVSGAQAGAVARALIGTIPEPRRATLRRLRDAAGETLDRALVLWFPGPETATGEDVLELHVHGGRAVIAAVERAVAAVPDTRRAEAGEFTRRALLAGRIDLAQAAGLADLLEAETELERRAALAMSEGAFSNDLRGWLDRLSAVRAMLEATIDYDGEGDVATGGESFAVELRSLHGDLVRRAAVPTSERVREGWRVVIAGPPNAGKSSLFNALLERDAAIVTPTAGTTRDRIEAPVQREGQRYTLIDTAGLAEWTDDAIEREGIRRSRAALRTADLVIWVAEEPPAADARRPIWVWGRCDEPGREQMQRGELAVSVRRPATIVELWVRVRVALSDAIATTESYLLHDAQQAVLTRAAGEVGAAMAARDLLIAAEHLRSAAQQLGGLLGIDHVDAMLDALFARFCVGK